jgi:hypothetical protein
MTQSGNCQVGGVELSKYAIADTATFQRRQPAMGTRGAWVAFSRAGSALIRLGLD